MKFNLQTKLILFGVVTSLIVLLMVIESVLVSKQKINQIKDMRLIATVTQRHMEGDMMHDAMRGDALAGILAINQNDTGALNQAKEELDEHYEIFKDNISQNQKEVLPDNIKSLF